MKTPLTNMKMYHYPPKNVYVVFFFSILYINIKFVDFHHGTMGRVNKE